MGSDDLFHKRKQAMLNPRQRGNKQPKTISILIATEDTDSSLYYFEALKKKLGITRDFASTIKIDIEGVGEDPSALVNFVTKKVNRVRGEKIEEYNKIFCVFDRDAHKYFSTSIADIEKLENWEAIYSIPCFEIWTLLHYCYTTQPTTPPKFNGNDSSFCDELTTSSLFNQYIPNYDKGDKSFFHGLINLLDIAKENSYKLAIFNENDHDAKQYSPENSPYPATKIHILVQELENLVENNKSKK